jgi:ribosomal-protein-alanine N-acetyltransferase
MSAGQQIAVRDLASADLAAVIGLVELIDELPRWPAEFYRSLTNPDSLVERIALIAAETDSGKVVGVVVASLVWSEAELETIAVAAEGRGKGIGRMLLFELVKKMRSAPRLAVVELLHLEVRASNSAAIGLYKSFGFKETGRRPGYFSEPVEDAILMTYELPILD